MINRTDTPPKIRIKGVGVRCCILGVNCVCRYYNQLEGVRIAIAWQWDAVLEVTGGMRWNDVSRSSTLARNSARNKHPCDAGYDCEFPA
jgi:hypothetical protein